MTFQFVDIVIVSGPETELEDNTFTYRYRLSAETPLEWKQMLIDRFLAWAGSAQVTAGLVLYGDVLELQCLEHEFEFCFGHLSDDIEDTNRHFWAQHGSSTVH